MGFKKRVTVEGIPFQTLTDACYAYGVSRATYWRRTRLRGMTPEEAILAEPSYKGRWGDPIKKTREYINERRRRYRQEKPEEFNRQKKKNYASSRPDAFRSKRSWTKEEEKLIRTSKLTDRELGKKIGRSVQAIQVRRSKLVNKEIHGAALYLVDEKKRKAV